jgi:hypothetical protein
VELSQKALDSLIGLVKIDIDEKIQIELSNIDSEITLEKIEIERRTKEIEILNTRISIIKQREKDIIKEMASINARIDELEQAQFKALKKEKKSEIESLALLLYSNEIQQSLEYHEVLNEKLSQEKQREENVNSRIQEELAKIRVSENSITNLKEKKGRIDFTKIIKEPSLSRHPVFPKKKLIVLIACIFSLMIFTLIAFLQEYIATHKVKE